MVKNRLKSKGFLHAVDAAIASFILVFFVGSLIAAPEPSQWDKMHIMKTGEDFLWVTENSGHLDSFIARNDLKSFRNFIGTLNSNFEPFITINGLPKRYLYVLNLVDDSKTVKSSTKIGNCSGNPLPPSEILRRNGSIYNVNFVLSDTEFRGATSEYTRVSFDMNGDGFFNASDRDEGGINGFSSGAVITCNQTSSNDACDGDRYEIFLDNDTLFLYNASFKDRLEKSIKDVEINEMDIITDIRTKNPRIESIRNADAIIAKGWNNSELSNHKIKLSTFIDRKGIFIEIINLSKSDFTGTYDFQKEIGFEWVDYSLISTGTENSVFQSYEPGTISYRAAEYFYNTPISLREWKENEKSTLTKDINSTAKRLDKSNWYIKGITSNQNFYLISNMTLKREKYHILLTNNSDSYDEVYFSTDTNFSDEVSLSESSVFTTPSNEYKIRSVNPLELIPQKKYTFGKLRHGKVRGNMNVLKSTNLKYDVSAFNKLVDTSTEITPSSAPFSEVPETDCPPYQYSSSFTVQGKTISAVLTNQNITGSCDNDYDYINFDFNGNGNYSDRKNSTPAGFGREGAYIRGEIAQINGGKYNLTPMSNGDELFLKRTDNNTVGALKAFSPDPEVGTAFLLPSIGLGDDDFSLLRSIIIAGSKKSTRFTNPKSIGETSIGLSWTGDLEGETYIPYSLETVWWYS